MPCGDPPFGRKNALRVLISPPTCVMCEQEERSEIKPAIARWYSNTWVALVCDDHDEQLTQKLEKDGWTIDKRDGHWREVIREETPPDELS